MPDFHEGVSRGLKVFAIPCGGFFATAGFRNNDVLVRVNGHDLSNTETALDAFPELKEARHIRAELLRGEAEVTIEFDRPESGWDSIDP